ncbi:MAG: electron transfer flavoprotein subunit beta/FixA family protein [Methylocystaceae bacterium]
MKIVVLVKQTFDTEAKIELKDGKISDAGINLIINPYDETAVEEALRIKEKGIATEVVVVSAGAEKSIDAIRTALAMGADRGILVDLPADADEYVRAKALAEAIKAESPNLVIAGHVAADDGSSQVPTRVAEILGLAHVTVVAKVEIAGDVVTATSEADGGTLVQEVTLPALVSCQVSLNEPRYPTMKGIMQAKKKPVANVKAEAMENKAKIVELSLPPAKQAGKKLDGDPEDLAKAFASYVLNDVKIEIKK